MRSMAMPQALAVGGRFDIGLGRGDSSRRVLGKKPLTVERMVEFATAMRGLIRGDEVHYDDTSAQLPWADGYQLPMWYAAYGPKALAAAAVLEPTAATSTPAPITAVAKRNDTVPCQPAIRNEARTTRTTASPPPRGVGMRCELRALGISRIPRTSARLRTIPVSR